MRFDVDISRFFSEEEINEIARQSGFVVRESPITGFNFLLTFTIGTVNTTDATLLQLAAFLNNTANINVSPQAIDNRLKDSAKEFLKTCLTRALNLSMKKLDMPNELINFFSHIYISDSTNFSLHPSLKYIFKGSGGNASPSAMRIQFIYDYLSGKMFIDIGDTRTADSSSLYSVIKNNKLDINGVSLFIQDLGYFNTQTFLIINDANDFFLSKLKYNVKISDLNGNEIDLLKLLKKNPQFLDLEIKIGGLKCRLVGAKLADNIINEKRRKANKEARKKGKTLSKKYKLFLSFGLFLTNLPQLYSFKTLFTIYRLRWQIELIFKTWKSILTIHKIHSASIFRVLCEVYGKLIIAVLSSYMCYMLKSSTKEFISYYKLLNYLKSIVVNWAMSIIDGLYSHKSFLKNLSVQLLRFCKKNKQKNKPVIEDLLLDLLVSSPLPIFPLSVSPTKGGTTLA